MSMQHPDTSWIVPQVHSFWDISQKRQYVRAVDIARRIVADPSLIERGRDYVETRMARDPRRSYYAKMWREVLTRSPEEIARLIISDTSEGDELRGSMPIFVVIDGEERRHLFRDLYSKG